MVLMEGGVSASARWVGELSSGASNSPKYNLAQAMPAGYPGRQRRSVFGGFKMWKRQYFPTRLTSLQTDAKFKSEQRQHPNGEMTWAIPTMTLSSAEFAILVSTTEAECWQANVYDHTRGNDTQS